MLEPNLDIKDSQIILTGDKKITRNLNRSVVQGWSCRIKEHWNYTGNKHFCHYEHSSADLEEKLKKKKYWKRTNIFVEVNIEVLIWVDPTEPVEPRWPSGTTAMCWSSSWWGLTGWWRWWGGWWRWGEGWWQRQQKRWWRTLQRGTGQHSHPQWETKAQCQQNQHEPVKFKDQPRVSTSLGNVYFKKFISFCTLAQSVGIILHIRNKGDLRDVHTWQTPGSAARSLKWQVPATLSWLRIEENEMILYFV